MSAVRVEEAVSEPAPKKKKRRRLPKWLRVFRREIGVRLMRSMGPPLIKLLCRTWKYEHRNLEHLDAARGEGGGFLLALWHGRMVVAMRANLEQPYTVLVSGSRDGDITEMILESMGFGIIRGSTSQGGARALRQMLGVLRAGHGVVITPDGPRGPRHSMNPGLAWMARATGFPILPVGIVPKRAWRLKRSWDQFNIPKPRTPIAVSYGAPVWVPKESSTEELQATTDRIRSELWKMEREGFEHLGEEPDF